MFARLVPPKKARDMDRDNAKGFGCGLLGNYLAAIRKTRRLAQVRRHALPLASFAFALAFSAPADAQFYPRWKHGWRPVEAAIVNRSNFTQVTPDGRVVAGPTDGAGPWETFRIFNQTDPDGAQVW